MECNLKYLSFLLLYGFSLYFLIASNSTIGLASHENESWKYLYLFCFIGLILIPISTVAFVLKSRSMGLDYKNRLQRKLNLSLIAIVVLMFFAELSLTPKTNIRVDLLLVIPALIAHAITFLIFTFCIKKGAKNL
jgi:hypothetical protein